VLRMTVLYPAAEDATFDWDHYDGTHMALLAERYGPHYARDPEVTEGVRALPKGEPAYLATAVLYFADEDALGAALRAGGMDVPDDIPNFTNTRPVMQIDRIRD